MADFKPDPIQQQMLEHLFDTTQDSPKDIVATFPMGNRGIETERLNYAAYLGLVTAGMIKSERHGEWITNAGILATSTNALENPTHVD